MQLLTYKNFKPLWEENRLIDPSNSLEINGISVQSAITLKIKKRLIKKRWIDTIPKKTSGIYKIINRINGKYYVGSTIDLRLRACAHLFRLFRQKHSNIKLQNSFNKNGPYVFDFEVVEFVEPENLLQKEQYHLDICSRNPKSNYNIYFSAERPGLGIKHSKQRLKKMSEMKENNKYEFFHLKTNEIFFGTVYELYEKYNSLNRCCLFRVAHEERTQYNGWILKKNIEKATNTNNRLGKCIKIRLERSATSNDMEFENLVTGEIFFGNRFQLVQKYRELSNKNGTLKLVRGEIWQSHGWVLRDKKADFFKSNNRALKLFEANKDNIKILIEKIRTNAKY